MDTENASTPVIRAIGLTKEYVMGDSIVHALCGVSFEIPRAAYVAIMGPSGSGKTTLLDIMGCLSQATEGLYELNGIPVSDLEEVELATIRNEEIGFVFQNFNLLARTSAVENVELPLLYSGVSRKDRIARAEATLESVGLGERMHHKSNELSGGERQRVAVARALVNNPSILFADEPTGNLDSKSGAGILELFDELQEKGNTIVMVTHEREVAEHAARILSFRDGLLVKDECRSQNEEAWELEYSVG